MHRLEKLDWLRGKSQREIEDISNTFWNLLSERAYPLSKGTIRVPISLEPFVLSHEEYRRTSSNLLQVISAARTLVEKYFIDEELRTVFALNEGEVELIEASKDKPLVGVVRGDLFYGSEPKMVELNADFPDGFFMHDVTAETVIGTTKKADLTSVSNAELFNRLLESENISKDSHIFVAYDKGRKFIDEFALTQQTLTASGWMRVSYGPIEDLEYKAGVFYWKNAPVDVIRRGVETARLRRNPELLRHLLESNVEIINNFKMRLLGHKSLLAALWDSRFRKYLSEEERLAVKTLVPETIKLEKANLNRLIEEKDQWVLKPSDLAEGEGISIGSSCSVAEWRHALEEAQRNAVGWLVQRKVEIPKQGFTIFESGEMRSLEMHYDFDPHVVLFRDHAEMGNILVRFSHSEVLNVLKGGGLTYAFIK